MGQDSTNPIQNTSYTSKDFEAVYPELLDLVKELTYRWDPSLSNESDPGVVLIKLLAIFEDKCNYNIDKNVLECFPLSVTQETNARQLFEQLGYYMNWYRGATTNVSLKWVDNEKLSEDKCVIPAFTMVTDADSGIVYSLIGPSEGLLEDEFSVGSQNLPCNGEIISFKAIQGVAVNYDISGETLITTQNLDENNRLYFSTTDIAENGIFIHNYGMNNYGSWKRKDNLMIEELGNTYYKFGVSTDGNSCYLEFPNDAEEIFKNGIYITYIKTLGADGNVAVGVIDKFYNDLAAYIYGTENVIPLNASNVMITNPTSSGDGKDKELINDAYRNYKKVVGTFTTLVTLRDYMNAINSSRLVSNCFVCDRTNDLQSTYKVNALVNDLVQPQTVIESGLVKKSVVTETGERITGYVEEPVMNAYSLKLYLLRYVNDVTNQTNFNSTFSMLSNDEEANIKDYILDNKLISHDYVGLVPPTAMSSHFCYFKNKYPLNFNVVTQYKLTTEQAEEVKANIKKALFKGLNAMEIDFGSDIDIDYVESLAESADDRIKRAKCDNIEYTTYAVYYDGENFKEVNITRNDELVSSEYFSTSNREVVVDIIDNHIETTDDNKKFINTVGNTNYSVVTFNYNSKSSGWTPKLEDYGITLKTPTGATFNPEVGDKLTARISLSTQFRDEVYTKSVLAGVTQFYVKDETYDYRLNQLAGDVVGEKITDLRGVVDISLSGKGTQESGGYVLRNNESIQFYAPNLMDSTKYSDYVKYQYIGKNVAADCDYELDTNEYIIFYWKEDDYESTPYSYYCYGKGNIIKPSFNLTQNNDDDVWCTGLTFRDISKTQNKKLVANSAYLNEMTDTQNANIQSLTKSKNILSGSKNVAIRTVNQVLINSNDYRCYWITENTRVDVNGNKKYVLFDDDSTALSKILGFGEYFIYSNEALTSFVVLGSGTKIERNNVNTAEWSVNVVDTDRILEEGTSVLTSGDLWYKLSSGSIITATENQFVTLNPGCVLYMRANEDYGNWSAIYSSSGVQLSNDLRLSNFKVSYKTSEKSEEIIYINDIALDKNVGWDAKSLLNVYMSPTVGLNLLSGQKVEYKIDGGGLINTIYGKDLTDNKYPVCLMSSHIISNNTSQFLSVASLDDYLNIIYPSIYKYSEFITVPVASDVPGVRYMEDGSVIVDIPADKTGDGNTANIKFGLPEGKYILKITNGSDSSTFLGFNLDGVAMHSMHDKTTFDGKAAGSYYLYLPMSGDFEEHTMSITMKGNRRSTTVILYNPYKYKKPSYVDDNNETVIMTDKEFDKIEKLIARWDINSVFSYDNEISEDVEITRPLLPKQFNNNTHIYNKFTICQFDTGTRSTIQVLGVNNGSN